MFPELHDQMRAHAVLDYPYEACGLVVEGGHYVPAQNVSTDPENAFEIDPELVAHYGPEQVLAVVHSHPDGPDHPSAADMRAQIAWDVPFGIVLTDGQDARAPFWWGDTVDHGPLIGRTFRPGVTDCYALVRAWFRQERGIFLPDCPREASWWTQGGSLLLDNYQDWGFRRVPQDQAQEGDVFFCMIRSQVPNHCGVIVPDQKILHQLPNRVSRREPGAPWARMFHTVARYEGGRP